MYLICHVTSQNLLIEWLQKTMGGISFRYISTLTRLVTINIVMVQICFEFVTWPHMTTCLKGYMNLWMEVTTLPCLVDIEIVQVEI